ncbi:hypothetical protein HAZT_HAZT006230 [Hyalella azteca]|uniref:Uncharacterized protein n=1 Tax=Hyalella azteca TaxID=294128 RepID=A0A6A0H478_HYAAZ|nr:hypothetical protein HAZT_HAZT006230 [Hyalella azteca]
MATTDTVPDMAAVYLVPHTAATDPVPHMATTDLVLHVASIDPIPHMAATDSIPHMAATDHFSHMPSVDIVPHMAANRSSFSHGGNRSFTWYQARPGSCVVVACRSFTSSGILGSSSRPQRRTPPYRRRTRGSPAAAA